ncbi:hypothetical protein ATK86_7351 [Nocardia fluminea]|uniref:Uncharacterized protein n=1 Tax=Nocardia fluminea TaxID=134984 RepID=A0A2N3V5Q4_9NOCA|nr:hypothetical protein ATK86_7351 [Nocardia fluminea]
MRCGFDRRDAALGRRRQGARSSSGIAPEWWVFLTAAAIVTISVGCVRPPAESPSPAPTAANVTGSASEPGAQPGSGPAPGGPIGQEGGKIPAPGGPVGPHSAPPAGGAPPPNRPGGGNQAKGSPVKIPSFQEKGSPLTADLKASIDAAFASACQEAGHPAGCVELAYTITSPSGSACRYSGFSPADGVMVEVGTSVTVQLSGKQPCPVSGDGTGGGDTTGDGGTTDNDTGGGTTDNGTPDGGSAGNGADTGNSDPGSGSETAPDTGNNGPTSSTGAPPAPSGWMIGNR